MLLSYPKLLQCYFYRPPVCMSCFTATSSKTIGNVSQVSLIYSYIQSHGGVNVLLKFNFNVIFKLGTSEPWCLLLFRLQANIFGILARKPKCVKGLLPLIKLLKFFDVCFFFFPFFCRTRPCARADPVLAAIVSSRRDKVIREICSPVLLW